MRRRSRSRSSKRGTPGQAVPRTGRPRVSVRGARSGPLPARRRRDRRRADGARRERTARPSPLEDGVTCALRRHVPVVVAGRTARQPLRAVPGRRSPASTTWSTTCERAATGPQLEHEGSRPSCSTQTLEHAGLPTESATRFGAAKRRGPPGHAPRPRSETSKQVRDVASVRVAGAVRGIRSARAAHRSRVRGPLMVPKTIVVPLDGSPLAERAVRVATPLAQRARRGRRARARRLRTATPTRPVSYLDGVVTPVRATASSSGSSSTDCRAADAIQQIASDAAREHGLHDDARPGPAALGRGRERGRGGDPRVLEAAPARRAPRRADVVATRLGRIVVCVDGSTAGPPRPIEACDWAKALDLEVRDRVREPSARRRGRRSTRKRCSARSRRSCGPRAFRCTRQLFRSSLRRRRARRRRRGARRRPCWSWPHIATPALAAVVLGSVTMGVLNTASCPVLVVPPELGADRRCRVRSRSLIVGARRVR